MDTKSAKIIADAIILHAEAIKGLSEILDKATGATRDMPYLDGLGIAVGGGSRWERADNDREISWPSSSRRGGNGKKIK